jgi:hypothetical protein
VWKTGWGGSEIPYAFYDLKRPIEPKFPIAYAASQVSTAVCKCREMLASVIYLFIYFLNKMFTSLMNH